MTRDRTRRFTCLAVGALLAISSVTTTLAASEPGGASPEQVFERMRTAATDKDYNEMAACLSPKGRAEMNGMLVVMTSMIAAFSGMGTEMAGEMAEATGAAKPAPPTIDIASNLEALLSRHGLTEFASGPPDSDNKDLPKELQSPELFADLMTFMDELPKDNEGESGPEPAKGFSVPEGELVDLEITGDHATGRIGDEPAKFVQVDGRWYIDPDLGLDAGGGNDES